MKEDASVSASVGKTVSVGGRCAWFSRCGIDGRVVRVNLKASNESGVSAVAADIPNE